MKVSELIEVLNGFNPIDEVVIGCEEETTTVYKDIEVNYVSDNNKDFKVVIWGNNGKVLDD